MRPDRHEQRNTHQTFLPHSSTESSSSFRPSPSSAAEIFPPRAAFSCQLVLYQGTGGVRVCVTWTGLRSLSIQTKPCPTSPSRLHSEGRTPPLPVPRHRQNFRRDWHLDVIQDDACICPATCSSLPAALAVTSTRGSLATRRDAKRHDMM